MGQDPEAIRQDIERQRDEMSETIDAIGYKAGVAQEAAQSAVSDIKETAQQSAQEHGQQVKETAQENAQDTAQQAKQAAQSGSPSDPAGSPPAPPVAPTRSF